MNKLISNLITLTVASSSSAFAASPLAMLDLDKFSNNHSAVGHQFGITILASNHWSDDGNHCVGPYNHTYEQSFSLTQDQYKDLFASSLIEMDEDFDLNVILDQDGDNIFDVAGFWEDKKNPYNCINLRFTMDKQEFMTGEGKIIWDHEKIGRFNPQHAHIKFKK